VKKIRLKLSILLLNLIRFYSLKDLYSWWRRDFTENSPFFIKKRVLSRNSFGGYWIETGTYFGQMTRHLSKIGSQVWTIEPEFGLLENAKKLSKNFHNITYIYGTSEAVLNNTVSTVLNVTKDINFWLDGHYSEGLTFKGDSDTPIKFELEVISSFKQAFSNITIFIDDVRCFEKTDHKYRDYPTLNFLVEWANLNKFDWKITHDILILKNISSQ
jgi:hypothetical protein